MIFTGTALCTSGVHCVACRDGSGVGRKWRASVGAPDDCPHGRPWGYQGEGKPIVTDAERADLVARRLTICEECEHSTEGDYARPCCDMIGNGKPCQFNSRLRNVFQGCPAQRWPALNLDSIQEVTTDGH